MSTSGDFGNPLRKFKLVFLGEQSGKLFMLFNTRRSPRSIKRHVLLTFII